MDTTLSKLIPVLLLVGLCLAACGQGSTEAKSDQARILAPDVPAGELNTLVSSNNTFALDLYQELHSSGGNLLYSPYSISLALAMTYGGARGETEAQMADTLHFNLPQADLHAAMNKLDLALEQKSEEDEDGNQPVQLDIANAIWGQQDHPFLPEYLDLLALNYGAGIHLSDFATQAEKTAEEINLWVSDQTHERIQDIIQPNALGEGTRLILVNAIYFNADWNTPFNPEYTHAAPFYLLDGGETQVDMMYERLELPYQAGSTSAGIGYQVVRLPYINRSLAMEILVPDQGQFSAFEAALDWQTLGAILGGFHIEDVRLHMPKFTFRSSFSLVGPLISMGMLDAFDPNLADFSGMDGTQGLTVSDVIHQAFVAVDEEGTEAAAATVVEMVTSAAPMEDEPIELTIDRPFFFLIRDLSSGQILFFGRVLNPAP
jgi:serpin B